jgi:predicted GH43/DUF377 family glycosyl hydrolase
MALAGGLESSPMPATRTSSLPVIRRPEGLDADDRRVITRCLQFRPVRTRSILRRILSLSDAQVSRMLEATIDDFARRHREIRTAFLANYGEVARFLDPSVSLSEERRLLIGAYFTLEYSFESAALFNPSIVPHPDQAGLPAGSVRFLLSLRATGEGHISSIVFRRGVIDESGAITFDPPPRFAYSARPSADHVLEKGWFARRLIEMGEYEPTADLLLDALPDSFRIADLEAAAEQIRRRPETPGSFRAAAADMIWLARANYELVFPADCLPAETVIYPATESEHRGMEDLRLTCFVDDAGRAHYLGTYTAFNGTRTRPMMLETADFTTFRIRTVGGRYARDKGMALFPRKINGWYAAIARHDGEKLYLLTSDNLYFWNQSRLLQAPIEPWEIVQLGNCGSPLETEAGWILLTHGVGAVRRYCIGAMLLDLNDPSRVLGRLRRPLLIPSDEEREGYVPNVVYSCGSMIWRDEVIIPYAMSDSATRFATVPLRPLLAELQAAGP